MEDLQPSLRERAAELETPSRRSGLPGWAVRVARFLAVAAPLAGGAGNTLYLMSDWHAHHAEWMVSLFGPEAQVVMVSVGLLEVLAGLSALGRFFPPAVV